MKFKVILKENKKINEAEPEEIEPEVGPARDEEAAVAEPEETEPEVEPEPEKEADVSTEKYLKQLNMLLQKTGTEVSKDFKILVATKNKVVQDGEFNDFWEALNKILLKEKTNAANLQKIFPGIFGAFGDLLKDVSALITSAEIGSEIGTSTAAGVAGDKQTAAIDLSPLCPPDNSEDPDIKRLWKRNIQPRLDKKGNVIDSKGNILIDKMKNRKGGTERRELAATTWLLQNKRFPNLSDLPNEEVQAFFNVNLARKLSPEADLARIIDDAGEWPISYESAIKFALGAGGGSDSPILKIVGQGLGGGGGLGATNQQAWEEVQEFFEGKWTPENTEKIKKETPEFCDAINEFIKRYMLNGMMDWQSKTKLKFINKYTTKLTKDQVTKGTDPGSKDLLRRGAGVSITANPEGSEEIASLKKKLEDLAKKEDLWKGKANMWDRGAPGDARLGKGKGKDAPEIKQAEARVRELQKEANKIRDELASNPKYIKKYFFNPFKHKKGESEELKVGADGSLDPRWDKNPGGIKTKKELDALEAEAAKWKKSQGITENINFYDLTERLINENENLAKNIDATLDQLTKKLPEKTRQKLFNQLRNTLKVQYRSVNDSLKNNKQVAERFKKWVTDGLFKLHKEPNFESEMKKQHPQGWPVVFFVQNQQYVESLQTIYAALHIITAFRDDMVKLAAAVDQKFDGISKAIGSRVDRLPAEKPREPGEPVQEEVEMVDAPEVEMNPAAAAEEPEKESPDELLAGISDIDDLYKKVYQKFNIEAEINEALKVFAQWFRHALLGKSSLLSKFLDDAGRLKSTDIGTGKKKGIYESIIKENCIVNNESNKDLSQLENIVSRFYPYVKEKLKFDQDAKLNLISDPENAKDAWGKTAYYNPEVMEITVFVDGRHPKDMLRSLSHELVHHAQNCRGEFDKMQALEPGYAQNDPHMRRMEGEAYLLGNGFLVRDFEDYLKSQQNQNLTENKKMKGLTKKQFKTVLENTLKRVIKEGMPPLPPQSPTDIERQGTGEERVYGKTPYAESARAHGLPGVGDMSGAPGSWESVRHLHTGDGWKVENEEVEGALVKAFLRRNPAGPTPAQKAEAATNEVINPDSMSRDPEEHTREVLNPDSMSRDPEEYTHLNEVFTSQKNNMLFEKLAKIWAK